MQVLTTAPSPHRYDSQTWDLNDPLWSRNDTLAIQFDLPTDLGRREGGKAFVDTTLAFSEPLGADYSGAWLDTSTFVVTILDPTGGGTGPRVGGSSGAVVGALVTVAGRLQNAPRTSEFSSASYRLSVGNFGANETVPTLLRFFIRDRDNANASYDALDEMVIQFDRAVLPGRCLQQALSVNNLPICAQRRSGGREYVDSLISVSAPLGAQYSGAWSDGSTFVVTVTEPYPDPEHAPRPYDTVLRIAREANMTNLAQTAPPLIMEAALLGVAERVETFPTPPRLVEVIASDFVNRDLIPGAGDTIALRFDAPTDRAANAFAEYAGVLNCDFSSQCSGSGFFNTQLARLFDFFDASGSRIVQPLFHEYSTGWFDDSTFLITVINGSAALQPGILAPSYRPYGTAFADSGTRVALRRDVRVQSLSCPAEFRGTPYCLAPTLSGSPARLDANTMLTDGTPALAHLPYLEGDFGRAGDGPRIVHFVADDPNNGDAIFSTGDVLTIVFDQRTNRGVTHSNYQQPSTLVYPANGAGVKGGPPEVVPYPLGSSSLSGKALVDALFEFSHPLGADYTGEWMDDSTFVVTIEDADGSQVFPPRVGELNVTARPSGGITNLNYTAKTCSNLTDLELRWPGDYVNLLTNPSVVNSSVHDCTLHYANTTSPMLTGDLGVPTFPILLSATLDDVDNGDDVYGVGDVLILQFDIPTNTPTIVVPGANSSRAAVDALFAFSRPLGVEYSGVWATPSRYIITVINPSGGALVLGKSTVTVTTDQIKNAAGDLLDANNQTVTITGDAGVLSEPAITRFTVVVAANATNYTDGDTMVLHFDMATNRGGGSEGSSGGKAYVDHLFGFSAVIAANYNGAWRDGESDDCADGGTTTLHPCFVITLLDTRGGRAVSGATFAAPAIHLRSSSGASKRSLNRLAGDRGRRLPPRLVDFVAADEDNSAPDLDAGDTLTIIFDRPTDLGVSPPQPWASGVGGGATSGDHAYVDSLFRFCRSSTLGLAWYDAGPFRPTR